MKRPHMQKTKPDDIKKPYMNIARRLQSVAHKQDGYAIIQMTILVNSDGIPITFTEPKMTKLEPKRGELLNEFKREHGEEAILLICELLAMKSNQG